MAPGTQRGPHALLLLLCRHTPRTGMWATASCLLCSAKNSFPPANGVFYRLWKGGCFWLNVHLNSSQDSRRDLPGGHPPALKEAGCSRPRYSRCWTAETRGPHSARRTWCGSRSTGGHSRPRTWSCGKSRRSEHRPCALPGSAVLLPLFSSLVLYSFQIVDAIS